MSDLDFNPYSAPHLPESIDRDSKENLRSVARCQRGFVGAVIAAFAVFSLLDLLPHYLVGILHHAFMATASVFVFLSLIKMSHPIQGAIFAILSFIPCFGLPVLWIVHVKVSNFLMANSIEVGLLGVNPNEI